MPGRDTYIEQAAADFGRHSVGGGGWALGLEVAACVTRGQPGRRPRNRRDHADLKTSASDFAARSGTSHDRVLRFLDAWQRAAAEGIVADADNIPPQEWADTEHLPEGYEWSDFYDAAVARNVRGERRERLEEAATRRGVGRSKVLDVASNPRAVAAALDADPTFAAAVEREQANARVSEVAAGLPEAPFDTPPDAYPGARDDAVRIDINRDVAHLHDAITRVERWTRTHRAVIAPLADRLDNEAELLHMVAEAARGASAADFDRLLEGHQP